MHTKGPWFIECESGNMGESFIISPVSEDCRSIVAYVGDILVDDEGVITQECVDNARLIAAAPELLCALEEMAAALERALWLGVPDVSVGIIVCMISHLPLEQVHTAIRKARKGPLCHMSRDIVTVPEDD